MNVLECEIIVNGESAGYIRDSEGKIPPIKEALEITAKVLNGILEEVDDFESLVIKVTPHNSDDIPYTALLELRIKATDQLSGQPPTEEEFIKAVEKKGLAFLGL